MQVNLTLGVHFQEQLDCLREVMFPGSDRASVRDSFILAQAIDTFQADPNILLELSDDKPSVQKLVTLRATTNQRLFTLSSVIKRSRSQTMRLLLKYHLNLSRLDTSSVGPRPLQAAGDPQQILELFLKLKSEWEQISETLKQIEDHLKIDTKWRSIK